MSGTAGGGAAGGGAAGRWRNWAGTQRATGIQVVRPRAVGEIVDAVNGAREAGRRVRPVGSGHSFTAIARPTDGQLSFDRYAGMVSIDPASGLVTVEAGMTIRDLNRHLRGAGLAMTNLGDIDRQTITGAISTGTHGTGARFGSLATQVAGMEMVLADGTVVSCSAEENRELFAAARVGLGALGVISTVTVRAERSFALRAEEGPMPLADVLTGFDELADGSDHFEFYWFPHTERALTKRNTRMPPGTPLTPLPRWKSVLDDEIVSNAVFAASIGLTRRVPSVTAPLNKVSALALGARTYTDYPAAVFTSPRRVRFVEMEYAVPRDQLVNVLSEIRATIEARGWRIPFPVEVRVSAGDDIPLSMAAGRDSGYVAVHLPAGADFRPYFYAVEAIAGEAGGRPHWGKMHTLDAATLAGRYPRFAEFVRLRDRLDPTGLFANPYLDRVLGKSDRPD